MITQAATRAIYPNVRLGSNVEIGEYVVLGVPPSGSPLCGLTREDVETIIEDGAVIRSHTVVYAGCRIGPRFQTGHHAVLGPGLEIGAGCSVGTGSVLAGFSRVRDGAKVHGHCYVGAFADVQEKAWIGPSCLIESHADAPTVIGGGAILGLHVQVRPGVRVGERALVGTKAFLERDVPPYRVAMGHPARAMRSIDQIRPAGNGARLYEPDPPDVRQQVLAQHESRSRDDIGKDSWRFKLWMTLGRPNIIELP